MNYIKINGYFFHVWRTKLNGGWVSETGFFGGIKILRNLARLGTDHIRPFNKRNILSLLSEFGANLFKVEKIVKSVLFKPMIFPVPVCEHDFTLKLNHVLNHACVIQPVLLKQVQSLVLW